MSLNKFSDIAVKKDWMDINCNEIKTTIFSADTIETDSISIVRNEATPVYITMTNEALPVNEKTYGFYSSTAADGFYISQFNDVPAVSKDYLFLSGTGGVYLPTEALTLTNGGLTLTNGSLTLTNGSMSCTTFLDLKTTGHLLNVAPSSLASSFYDTFTTVANIYSGPYAAPIALEYSVTRVGKQVSIMIGTIVSPSTISDIITASIPIPASFRPPVDLDFVIRSVDNSIDVAGCFEINATTGVLTAGASVGKGVYQNIGNAGFRGVCLSYTRV